MTTRLFVPARRDYLDGPPETPLSVRPPPPAAARQPINPVLLLMPMVMLATVVGFVVLGGLGPTSLMMGTMMLAATAGMLVSTRGGPTASRHEAAAQRHCYLTYLARMRRLATELGATQRESAWRRDPAPRALFGRVGGTRMWERDQGAPDALHVRFGVGDAPVSRPLTLAAEEDEDRAVDPICQDAARRLLDTHQVLTGMPRVVSLPAGGMLTVDGPRARTVGMVRAMVAAAVLAHGPDALLVGAVVNGAAGRAWEWLKWLPHNQHPVESDLLGPRRMVFAGWEEADQLVRAATATPEPAAGSTAPAPHVLLIADGVSLDGRRLAQLRTPATPMTILALAGRPSAGRVPTTHLRCDDAGAVALTAPGLREQHAQADWLSQVEADALARRLAPFRLPTQAGEVRGAGLAADLGQLLGIVDPAKISPTKLWQSHCEQQLLRVPIGLTPHGDVVYLDLKEPAQGGVGPHGLVVGATGSGKSELLRTLVAALAITHSPDQLNFVLVDFKGGATFAGLAGLPHTAAVITNLADDLALVDRMFDALSGELARRQELLRDAGNFSSIRDYEQARRGGQDLPPIPSLLIVCDEFSEMLSQKPHFVELFVMIGRLGRSLGLHLLLASQRLDEGRLHGLESHLSYRIGLRTFSTAESRAVLGVPDAYELPSMPGSALLKSDGSIQRFTAGYVSGPYRPPLPQRAGDGSADLSARAMSFVCEAVQGAAGGHLRHGGVAVSHVAPEPPPRTSVLDVVVSRLRGSAPQARAVWLPPLEESPTLDQLMGPVSAEPAGGVPAHGWPGAGKLRVAVGSVDLPFQQRRDHLIVDLSGSAGHSVVVGGPRSGKSVALRTIITALALTHSPGEVQFYVLDLGGGSLSCTQGLPHVGGYGVRANPDFVRRLLAEVDTVITEREDRFQRLGIETMADYRALRRGGSAPNGSAQGPPQGVHESVVDPFGDVVLVIDGWGAFRRDFEDLEPLVSAIASRGLSYGVHLMLAANRWSDLRPAMRDSFGTRVELKLGDHADSEVDRHRAASVPAGSPGRGLDGAGRQLLMALPRLDSRSEHHDLAQAYRQVIGSVGGGWQGPSAPAVRTLPRRLPADTLSQPSEGTAFSIGIGEDRLAPVFVDFSVDPHLLYLADAESGKTNALRLVAAGIMARHSSAEARILPVDYRRTMLDHVPPPYLAGYAAGAPGLAALVADLEPLLRKRLPGPEVTTQQLRERSWWSGPEVFVLVDDYDLVAAADNPLLPLAPLVVHGKDIGLHLVLARRVAGYSRAMFDPVLQRIREMATPTIVGAGNDDEGPIAATVRAKPTWPPGRAMLVTRKGGQQLIQVARVHAPAATE